MPLQLPKIFPGAVPGEGPTPPHELIKKSDLTQRMNLRVTEYQTVERQLEGPGGGTAAAARLTHRGGRVTLEDGSKHLIHKMQKTVGKAGSTVMVRWEEASADWKAVGEPIRITSDVNSSGFINAANARGEQYFYVGNNCIDGENLMKGYAKKHAK